MTDRVKFSTAPIHHILLAVYPALFLYTSNWGIVEPRLLLHPLAISASAALAAWIVFSPVLGSRARAAVLVSLWLILFYSYGHVYGWVFGHVFGLDETFARFARNQRRLHWILGTAWVIGFLAVPLVAERMKDHNIELCTAMLNWFGIALLVLLSISLVHHNLRAAPYLALEEDSESVVQSARATGDQYPDVFVIVLDSYARQGILTRHFVFPNHEFIAQLESIGFQISGDAMTNYGWTYLSLPSMLNFDYIQNLLALPDPGDSDMRILKESFQRNRVASVLRSRGLQHIHLQSTYSLTMRNPLADWQYVCESRFGADFHRVIVESSFLRIWTARVGEDLAACHLEQFERLESIAGIDTPKFVFAHFIPPHHPYLFDRDGNVKRQLSISDKFDFQAMLWKRRDEYLDQLIFINRRITDVIETILERSSREALILLVSDHGPQLLDGDGEREPDFLHARFANLIALRTPDDRLQLPDDVTLVNVFRYILNAYFDQELEILDNRFFDSRFNYPYDLEEIHFERE